MQPERRYEVNAEALAYLTERGLAACHVSGSGASGGVSGAQGVGDTPAPVWDRQPRQSPWLRRRLAGRLSQPRSAGWISGGE